MKSKYFDALLKKSKEKVENQIMEMEAKRSGEQLVHPLHLSHHTAIIILPIGYMLGDHMVWHVVAAMVILFPLLNQNGNFVGNMASRIAGESDGALDDFTKICLKMLCGPDGELPEKLKNLKPHLIEHGSNEIMHRDPNVRGDDTAGLEHAKKCVTEMVIWPYYGLTYLRVPFSWERSTPL